jgi:2-polyprenyl-6-hydroxyphenyl methylase/3-demethylubiquinone-9 3-methyltransferase
MPQRRNSSIAADEVARFSRHAEAWWDPDGPLRPLHRLNPARIAYVRDQVAAHFGRDRSARCPLKGLSVLDAGCGGGLLAEPLSRLGASVTGLDASVEAIAEARRHAQESGLAIDYRYGSVEKLVENFSKSGLVPLPLREGLGAGYKKKSTPSPAKTKDLPRGKSKFSLPLPSTYAKGFGGLVPQTLRSFSVGGQGEREQGYDVIAALEIVEHVADMDSFIASLAKLLKPKGLLILSTLNRTPKSFLLGIVAAEYVLRWVPRGTHRWNKFLRPSELVKKLEAENLATIDLTGLVYRPMTQDFALSKDDLGVNYLLTAAKG